MERQLCLQVSGRVQGVGYRMYIQRHAVALKLTGYARNMPDGSVEVVAQGAEANLRRLCEVARKGPRMARVDDIEALWSDPTTRYETFSIH